ncbi:MAG: tetratricopeptide repeat protein [Chloroflexia bacterium]|nr:tetratricopeptide repeat protein [Chloroflexia bacterium]
MSTRLRRWCDILLEGGWLLAVVLVTLYFNIYTKDSRIFEPQKALILRTLVTMMLSVWAIRVLEENRLRLQQTDWWRRAIWIIVGISAVLAVTLFVLGFISWQNPLEGMADAEAPTTAARITSGLFGAVFTFILSGGIGLALVAAGYALRDSWRDALRTAMVVPALVYVLVHIIATIGSVFPTASFYGGYVRQQGTLTVMAYIGLFFVLAFNLRRREQLERLVSVILLSSIPSALYGVVQKFGVDPLPWMGDVQRRVASTMGNAIFIAAYLIMILPLTGYRLLNSWDRLRNSPAPEQTPDEHSPILGSLYPGLLWGGSAVVLAAILIITPIALSVQQAQLKEAGNLTAAEQIWPNYGQNLLLFAGVALLTLVLPAVVYLVITLIGKRWRPQAHQAAMVLVVVGAAVLLFVEATRINGFAWAGYLIGLGGLALLSRRQHASLSWGSDALWSNAVYILLLLQSLFLFVAIKAYLPTSPYPTKWPLYLVALLVFFASCLLVTSARIRGRIGYMAEFAGYLVLAGIQLICIVLTQSRGPLTGLLASLFVFALLWTWRRQVRWGTSAILVIAALGVVFLAIFNLPNTPLLGDLVMDHPQVASFVQEQLEPMKKIPYLGRLGMIFEASEGTGKVRILIWFGDEIGEGSVGMIKSHPLRTLIGFGPEAMHVAYNPYYPPELAHVEKRNASPDRAHNAIIDELVTMGALGLAAYFFYFISFFVLVWQLLRRAKGFHNQALLVALFALGTAHFVESLTGIPIVSTRMYMWVGIGMALALSFMEPFSQTIIEQTNGSTESTVEPAPARRSRRRSRRFSSQGLPTGWSVAYLAIALAGLVLSVRLHLEPMWADILFWRSKQMEAQAQAYRQQATVIPDQALSQRYANQAAEFAEDSLNSLHRAISLVPREDFYYLSLAQVYLNGAQVAANNAEQQEYFASTQQSIVQARDLSPLNTDHYRNLSALYLAWFAGSREAEELGRAIAYGEQAISLTRNNADLRNRLARAYLTAAGAGAKIQEMAGQTGLDWLQQWGQFHSSSGGRSGDTHLPLVEDYRQQAQQLLLEGNYQRGLLVLAAAELQYSLFLDEKYDDTYLLAGDLYRTLEMPAEASLMYGAGVRMKPNLLSDAQAEARIKFVAAGGELAPMIAGYQDAADKEEATLTRLEGQDKPAQTRSAHRRAAQAYQALGYIYIVQGEPEIAVDYYLSALSHQETLDIRKNLAVLYQQIDEPDLALEQAQAALELAREKGQTQDVEALQSFIQQLQQQEQALTQMEAYVAENPQDYQARYDLAGTYRQLGRMEQALEQAQLAAQYVPTDQADEVRKVYTRLGNYAFLMERYDVAEPAFLQVLEVAKDNYNAYYKLGYIYYTLGRLDEAKTYAEEALNLAPDSKRVEAQALVDQLKRE